MSKASGDWGALIGGATRRFVDFEKISDGKKRKKMADEKMDVREIIQDLQVL